MTFCDLKIVFKGGFVRAEINFFLIIQLLDVTLDL